jgi:ssDNA-binding replication factor A large subunit
VRVVSKPSIRTWSNSRGEGRVLNVDLVDETGEIRAVAFNEVADKMQGLLEMGQVSPHPPSFPSTLFTLTCRCTLCPGEG